MNNFQTIKKVQTPELETLRPIFRKYLQLNEQLVVEWEGKDVPWWYNERASLGLFAAAIWKKGGIVFEEYSVEKKRKVGLSRKAIKYKGRNDLYFKYKGEEFIVEAKKAFVAASTGNGSAISAKFDKAKRDVKRNNTYGLRRLAVLFVVPRFQWKHKEVIDSVIKQWLIEMQKNKYSAAAWIFPSKSMTRARWKKTNLFPGIAMLVKEV